MTSLKASFARWIRPQPEMPTGIQSRSTLTSSAPWRVYNIGGGRPVPLLKFISCIETVWGKKPGFLTHATRDVVIPKRRSGSVGGRGIHAINAHR